MRACRPRQQTRSDRLGLLCAYAVVELSADLGRATDGLVVDHLVALLPEGLTPAHPDLGDSRPSIQPDDHRFATEPHDLLPDRPHIAEELEATPEVRTLAALG